MLRNRFRRSYWYRNVAIVALVLFKHTWKYEILKLHLQLLKLHLKLSKNIENIKFSKNIEKMFLSFFDFFQIFQKVFPCIPEGYIRKESDENLVLSNFYLSFGDSFFDIVELFFENIKNKSRKIKNKSIKNQENINKKSRKNQETIKKKSRKK